MMPIIAFDDSAVQHAAQHGDPLRSTALLMHTMTAADRSWVMNKLKPEQREAIAPLLAELDTFEFSTDGFKAGPPPVDSSLKTDAQRIAVLDALPVSRIQAALQGEPAALVRRLAAIHRWSWREAVCAGCETTAGEVHAVSAAAKPTPTLSALDRAVLDALQERINAQCPAAEAQDDRCGRWHAAASVLRQGLGRMARPFARDTSPTLS
jgi:hypothetical protein